MTSSHSPSGQQLAQEIGVDPNTLETWVDELKIPLPDKYQRNALQVLKMVKELKDKNCGFQTIRRQIQLDYPELQPGQPEENFGFDQMQPELLQLGELAEKYAQANFRIGQMDVRMQQLEAENRQLQAQLKLLPSATEWEDYQEREKTYKNLLSGCQQRLSVMEAQLRELSGLNTESARRSLPDLPPPAPKRPELKLPFEDGEI